MSYHKIVVGIDFAWANTSSPDHITMIGNWPSASSGSRTSHSTPTEIAYAEGSTTDFKWGYDIPASSRRLKWFKLLLDRASDDERVAGLLPMPTGKTAVDVTRDFLSALYLHTMETLWRQNSQAVMAITKVEFVICTPAIWSEAAKSRTRRAVEEAGIGAEHELQLLSEPEAGALYAVKLQENSLIKPGDRIVVCDAGGGTVDLISYAVHNISPRFEVRESAVGTGDFAGSTYIDREFERYLKARMGTHFSRLKPEVLQRVMRNFEEVKCAFDDRPGKESFYVSIPTFDSLPEAKINLGEMEISRADMRQLFDPVVQKVLTLVDGQIKAQGGRVNAILLIGGFGESKYLYRRLQDWAKPQGIEVIQPRDAATAVVKGAVMRGLQSAKGIGDPSPGLSIVRLARRHYGTPMSTIFVPGRHDPRDMYTHNVTGALMAKDQVAWFISKGSPMAEGTRLSRSFTRSFRKYEGPWIDSLVTCDLEVPPPRMEPTVRKLCDIETHMDKISKKNFERSWRSWKRFYTARYTLQMEIGGGDMKFELVFGEVPFGQVKVDFEAAEAEARALEAQELATE